MPFGKLVEKNKTEKEDKLYLMAKNKASQMLQDTLGNWGDSHKTLVQLYLPVCIITNENEKDNKLYMAKE